MGAESFVESTRERKDTLLGHLDHYLRRSDASLDQKIEALEVVTDVFNTPTHQVFDENGALRVPPRRIAGMTPAELMAKLDEGAERARRSLGST